MGLNANAAAGVAGNIYQESHGDPAAYSPAGGGLFGLTNANGGNPHGGTLVSELAKLKKYITDNGSISDINAHSGSPKEAADWFSNHYERPGIPALQNREEGAEWIAAAAQSGNWSSGVTQTQDTSASGLFSFPSDITGFFGEADKFVTALLWLINPASWVRIGAFLVGVALLFFAIHAFIAVSSGSPILKTPDVIPVPV